ncbi:hypothetical protein JCM10212_000645 [Sporobolomyces blumeae]
MFPSNYLDPIPRHGLPGEPFTYVSPLRSPCPLVLSVSIPPVRHAALYANYVWNASVLLADKVANDEIDVEGRTVVELGCGVGLAGIVAACKDAEQVVLSDYDDPSMLADLCDSLDESVPTPARARIVVVGHSFRSSTDALTRVCPRSDFVFVSDCIWTPSLHAPLLDTLVSLLSTSPNAEIHMTAGFHTGRRVVREFVEQAHSRGIVFKPGTRAVEISVVGEVRSLEWGEPPGIKPGTKEGSLVAAEERQEERNRWTFYGVFVRGF